MVSNLDDRVWIKCSDEIDPDYADYLEKLDQAVFEAQLGSREGSSKGKRIDNIKRHAWEITVTAATLSVNSILVSVILSCLSSNVENLYGK
jgi:hypothetical protein